MAKKVNPFAVCTSAVGRKNRKKYEDCIMNIKKRQGMAGHKKRRHKKGKKHGAPLPKAIRHAASKIKKHISKLEREEAKVLSSAHKLQAQIKELKSLT